MFKAWSPYGFNTGFDPITIVRIHSRGVDAAWMKQAAASSTFAKDFKDFKLEKGHTLIHVCPVAASEDYSCNVNGDGFKRATCEKYHDTFLAANKFTEHDNKNPARGCGRPVKTAYNKNMKRVELLVDLPNEKNASIIQDLENGRSIDWSMACRIDYDVCLKGCTPVLTDHGYRNIENIRSGDLVLTHLNRWREVDKVHTSIRRRPACRLSLRGFFDDIECTANHEFWALSSANATHNQINHRRYEHDDLGRISGLTGFSTPMFLEARTLRQKDIVLVPCDEPSGDTEPEFDPWVLGLTLADGSVFGKKRGAERDGEWYACGVQWSLGTDKLPIIYKLLKKLEEAGLHGTVHDARGSSVVVVCYSKRLAEVALTFGRCQEKHISVDTFSWLAVNMRALLAGWLDGDGHQDRDKGHIRGTTVLPELARGLYRVSLLAGVPASVHKSVTTSEWGESKYCHVLCFGRNHAATISEHSARFMEAESTRVRKDTFYLHHEGHRYLAVPVLEVEATWLNRTFNLSVREDNTYVAGQGAVVHNCNVCGNMATTPHGPCDQATNVPSPGYCKHASDDLGALLADGHRVYVHNPHPHWFDISDVKTPAEVMARTVQFRKAAGISAPSALGGAELASRLGIGGPLFGRVSLPNSLKTKLAIAKKLAEIEKRIPLGDVEEYKHLAAGVPKTTKKTRDQVKKTRAKCGSSDAAFRALRDQGIILDLVDFVEVAGLDSEHVEKVAAFLPQMFSSLEGRGLLHDTASNGTFDWVDGREPKSEVVKLAAEAAPALSFDSLRVRRRLIEVESVKIGSSPLPAEELPGDADDLLRKYASYILSELEVKSASGESRVSLPLTTLWRVVHYK